MAQARNLEFFKFEFLAVLWFFGTNWHFVILNFSNLGRVKIDVKKCKIIKEKFGYVKKNADLYYRNEGRSPYKETKKLQTFKITKL